MEIGKWTLITYMQAGAYAAIMFAVLGVPQLLSSYFDYRMRRQDRRDNEANAERRHQENLQAEGRREERQEERRLEERRLEEERRREERQQEEERRRQEEERRREERQQEEERRREDEERRRQETAAAERRHQELMALLVASLNNRGDAGGGQHQSELVQALRQTIETLEAENARLRRRNGNGNDGEPSSH